MNILLSCIGRRGYIADYFRAHLGPNDRIIGTSNTEWTSGFKACDLGVVMPDIQSPEYVPVLIELCREHQVDALLSFFDPDINVLSRHLDEFRAARVLPVIPSSKANDICFDKYGTYIFLREHDGLDAPETFLSLEEAVSAVEAGKATFPFVVKPRRGFASLNLFRASHNRELEVFFHYAPDMMIQEMLTGQECHLDICNDLRGQVLAVVPKRKISMRAGETDQAETCDDPDLIDLGLRLGRALGRYGHVGPLDVDLFVQDGRATILEMNPRFGGAYPASHLAGADFPRLLLDMIRGDEPEPRVGEFRSGAIMMKEYSILGGEPLDVFCSNVVHMRANQSGQGMRNDAA